MKCFKKWISAALAFALLASTAAAADSVASGKIKAIDASNKSFVLTDLVGKDHNFKIGDKLVVNRAGKESNSDLKVGDSVNVCFEPGVLTWTSHYILIQEGSTKDSTLTIGAFKSYDSDKKRVVFTDSLEKGTEYAISDAPVRVNMKDGTVQDLKIGEQALLILNNVDGKSTLMSVMVHRAE